MNCSRNTPEDLIGESGILKELGTLVAADSILINHNI